MTRHVLTLPAPAATTDSAVHVSGASRERAAPGDATNGVAEGALDHTWREGLTHEAPPRGNDRQGEPDGERPLWPALRRGFLRRCPHCGEGHLFEGYLKVARTCPACGEELFHHRADDGPAYLTILIVGHVLAVAMHLIWTRFRPEPLVFATLLTIFAVALSLWLLPRLKGAIVGFQWARWMHGFGDGD